ncbi:putative protein C10orf71 [Channa argus]|uniref:DUF4585 domain-containing protein n=1 Tax=Channa argus TaxID=215402 RepID=A0A6G1QR42_CHAAH|nr:putative protein C10orf71 [Channa argus]
MSCVEKRHTSHRAGSMLHHRFPNGFTDLFMDETDREVSTLTDRAFRSLCVGDEAVYNDEFLYGYSPFSCHKPLAGEPLKKTHRKDSKKLGQNKNDAQLWKQQKHKNQSQMSSFLKVMSATEESCEGLLIKNGGMMDSNGESWDKSALRSIQKELSEFSDYNTNLTDEHYKKAHLHQSGDGSSNKTVKNTPQPSGRIKNGKSTVKLRKLNIKNFFLHSEFSPFQTWRNFNQFPFGHEETVNSILPIDNIPKWYDMLFYKELTEAHRKETLHTEGESCQKAAIEPPALTAPKPIPPPPPPKVLPKPSATPAEKRCSSDRVDGTAAPWRRNRSRAKSAIQANQPWILSQDNNLKTVEENLLLVKKEPRSVDVKAIEEISSTTSTPFSICQLMTPTIPPRQPTETSEILSPSALDLPLRPHSEAKAMPEPQVKRDSYKSLASSILFNLKDNRKRVKSHYSPPKFKILELPENGTKSPQPDYLKNPHAGSEGNASGLSTPADLKDTQTVCSPTLETTSTPSVGLTKQDAGRPLSDDYLLANLLQTKREVASGSGMDEDNYISPFIHSKKNKNPRAKKQNYPSLHLYKKASPADGDMKYLQAPLSTRPPEHIDQPTEAHELSPFVLNRQVSPKGLPTNTGLSSNTSNFNKDQPPMISPHPVENERLSSNISVGQKPLNVPNKAKQLMKDAKEKALGAQPLSREKDTSGQILNTMDVIRAAREAISAAKTRALSAAQSETIKKSLADIEELQEKENDTSRDVKSRNESTTAPLVCKNTNVKPEPPPVPKRHFIKSDIQLALDKQQTNNLDNLSTRDLGDLRPELPPKENEAPLKQDKLNHVFSAKQNNYIKYQRYTVLDGDDQVEEYEEGDMNVNTRKELDDDIMSIREMRDSEHIINDLHALKELERARLGERTFENKQGLINIADEARAKNNLISRELRNIKKGMLSMRGNTLAKKELFAKKEKEQRRHEAFTKVDSNVVVNKALINDNYDKAKMALEEIISERQKRKNKLKEHKANPISEENGSDESCETRVRQSKTALNNYVMEGNKNSSTFTVNEDLKQVLEGLKDHNHRQILSHTEPRLGESQRSGGIIALPGTKNTKSKHISDKLTDEPDFESEEVNCLRHVARPVPQESEENLVKDTGAKTLDVPAVPPRSKKPGSRCNGIVTEETDEIDEDVFDKNENYDNREECLEEMIVAGSEIQCGLPTKEPLPDQSECTSEQETWDVANNLISKSITATNAFKCEAIIRSPEFRRNEKDAKALQRELNPTREDKPESSNVKSQESSNLKQRAPLKPDHVKAPYQNNSGNLVAEDQPDKNNRPSEKTNVETDAASEIPRNIISPLLLVNGVSLNQSPPDQASLSSKSSYFSVESALHRNTETGSNVYRSLENLVGEVEDVDGRIRNVSRNTKSDRTEMEYYSLSDHESEADVVNKPAHQKEGEVQYNKSDEGENTTTDQSLIQDENNRTTMSPSNTFLPTLGIPTLFKVKNNTFASKSRKAVIPCSPGAGLSGVERGEELNQVQENPVVQLANESITSDTALIPADISQPKENLLNQVPLLVSSPSQLQNENPKKPQDGQFLTVPQEEDRFSGVSPSSEGLESFTASTADTADEMGMNVESEVPKVPSECSGSTCSGNEGQTGLPKPPAVLPKSEKAILRAIKLANRRMKKEEAQKSLQKPSQSSSKHRAEKHCGDKPESKTSTSSRNSSSSEKKRREKAEDAHRQRESERSEQVLLKKRGDNNENDLCQKTEVSHKNHRQNHNSGEGNNNRKHAPQSAATERQGRSSDRHIHRKLDQRHYSSDRVISKVPVYKAHVGERPMSDRPFNRSQSTDRYLGDKLERKLSADMSVNERLDPRTQHNEECIIDECQQRGRARDKASRDNPLRRSQSIDAYSTEVPHPTALSRQSSHTSQLSRQSSIEHTIVTQSFPMTQRKLLQDPDSGQYFFVDMPVQVKTKTFFDPETGSYVQLPLQPPEGAVPQASPMEVLTPPLVVYHGFVPVPLSPLARKTTIQAPHVEPEGFEQRRLERSRQTNCTDGHVYLEPIYNQHEQIYGEFLATKGLDCPS